MQRPTPLPVLERTRDLFPLSEELLPRFKITKNTSAARLAKMIKGKNVLLTSAETSQFLAHPKLNADVLDAVYEHQNFNFIKRTFTMTSKPASHQYKAPTRACSEVLSHELTSDKTLLKAISRYETEVFEIIIKRETISPTLMVKLCELDLQLLPQFLLTQLPSFKPEMFHKLYEKQSQKRENLFSILDVVAHLPIQTLEENRLTDLLVKEGFKHFSLDSLQAQNIKSSPSWVQAVEKFVQKRVPGVDPKDFPFEILSSYAQDLVKEE